MLIIVILGLRQQVLLSALDLYISRLGVRFLVTVGGLYTNSVLQLQFQRCRVSQKAAFVNTQLNCYRLHFC